jgi:hypothetical protein
MAADRRDLLGPIPLGCGFLAAGFAVYAFARPLHGANEALLLLVGSAPTFLHTAAFALLTAAVLGSTARRAAATCLAWMGINVLFELGQHPRFAATLANALPAWFDRLPVLDRVGPFFSGGRFDALDLAAAAAGAGLGWFCLQQCAAARAGDSS